MINLDVTVRNGIPPLPITIDITCLDDHTNNLSFSKDMGFNETYNLAPGRYTLIVNGMNPDGGDVAINVAGDFQTGPLPSGQYASSTPTYTAVFYFVIQPAS